MREETTTKNILLIGRSVAPVQSVASIRWTKIAKYLKRSHDVNITVLTNYKQYDSKNNLYQLPIDKKDELLNKDLVNFSEYHEVPFGEWSKVYFGLKKRIRRFLKIRQASTSNVGKTVADTQKCNTAMSWKELAKHYFFDLQQVCWAHDVFRYAKKELELGKYDVVISSFGPIWPHFVAEKIKKVCPDILWIADFRDPYASVFEGREDYRRHQRCTMKHCAAADVVLRVNDLMETFTPPHVPVYTVSNGFDPEEILPPICPSHFNIVFTGTLYGNITDIGIACEMVKKLCAEGKMIAEDVSVIYIGGSSADADALARIHNAESVLKNIGFLPRKEAMRFQQTAAILLQACSQDAGGCIWTGKMYEYMAAQKPIIYIITGNATYTERSEKIRYLGGCCYEEARHEETYSEMEQYILEKYREWKRTGNVTVSQDKVYIAQYAYPEIAERVWNIL